MKNLHRICVILFISGMIALGLIACKDLEEGNNAGNTAENNSEGVETPTLTPTLTSTPTPTPTEPPKQVLSFTPVEVKKSLLDFLKIAVQPVGSTMYVWGGGWNEEDTGAGIEAVTLGLSPAWAEFAAQQDSSYNYRDVMYHVHKGLDCSGYIGWAVYNTFETENGKSGYVFSATGMAAKYAELGFGTYIPTEEVFGKWQAGDIMSMKGHVWIVAGVCEDGSVLMLHASLPGVAFSGTKLENGQNSQAVALAKEIMSTYYPEWYAKYPNCAKDYEYLTISSAMRWSRDVLRDDERLSEKNAKEIVELLFKEE